jgi:hypothetical protein
MHLLGGWSSVFVCFPRGDQGGAACHLACTTTRLDGMMQRSLCGRRVTMDARREVALSGVMVASMEKNKVFVVVTLKIAQRFDRGNNLCSVCVRYSLRVC